jgi:hypothetical protein
MTKMPDGAFKLKQGAPIKLDEEPLSVVREGRA